MVLLDNSVSFPEAVSLNDLADYATVWNAFIATFALVMAYYAYRKGREIVGRTTGDISHTSQSLASINSNLQNLVSEVHNFIQQTQEQEQKQTQEQEQKQTQEQEQKQEQNASSSQSIINYNINHATFTTTGGKERMPISSDDSTQFIAPSGSGFKPLTPQSQGGIRTPAYRDRILEFYDSYVANLKRREEK